MALGWGFDPYGTSPFGAAAFGEGVSILAAVAMNTKEVRVYLTSEPRHVSPTGIGDALNPATWTVQRLDTLAYLPVMAVVEYSPTVFGVVLATALGDAVTIHEVSSATLLDAGGGIILPPRKAQFAGLIADTDATTQAKLAKRGASIRDIANPQSPRTLPDVVGGTLVIGSSGDYETVTGVELIKKLIIRRLTTGEGDFFHLPKYGIASWAKEVTTPSNLAPLRAAIERQVLKEPEVSEAAVALTLSADDVLKIAVKATIRPSGERLEFSFSRVTL